MDLRARRAIDGRGPCPALGRAAQTAYGEPGSVLGMFCHTLVGAALCRAGRGAEAIVWLEHPPAGATNAWDWLFLTRAHHDTGDKRSARHWMRQTLHWLGWPTPKATESPRPLRLCRGISGRS